jgi:hypothetical protein
MLCPCRWERSLPPAVGDKAMTGLVTIVQPAGFALGVFASSVALATLSPQGRLPGSFNRGVSSLIPVPVVEQSRIALVGRN